MNAEMNMHELELHDLERVAGGKPNRFLQFSPLYQAAYLIGYYV